MAPQNYAAWQLAPKAPSLEVKEAPYTPPAASEILIRNHAVAVNPVEPALQSLGPDLFPWVTYPQIFGNDIAGEVVEVGPGVDAFKPGDRVVAHALNLINNKTSEGGFQLYTIVSDFMAAPIPDSISYEQASVLPLAVSTASCGLYQDDQLALELPTVPARPSTGKTVLIWGGASSVGCSAIQLAVASGYEVVTVASPKNFDLLKKLGAAEVFDYNAADVVDQIVGAFADRDCAGGLAIVTGSLAPLAEVLSRTKGAKFVSNISVQPADLPEGVKSNVVFGGSLRDNRVGRGVYAEFLGKALAAGSFTPAPKPYVVSKGLESVQKAFDVSKEGVSAKKVVVSLA
ncbi:zinc-binding dehydrogenase family superfamily [Colletotrichum tofieldiae]|uniref:Zinc-binding dehydrogenase family superfamily n=1 Tax=Colletotrichum tofieldiae TaxID=708197 RepID=A0A166ZDV0_9PEZI|nr:zinc-binding dehydrogenase family superfamily [Colletotrichum tofieldiae]GKT55779.1 zinc-binding dehydrogenase family superfamily [Colletotrichum tofieldiae]GKT79384.1 zinc-binding dehydrogenase family superfamily [Colletotrichum tofieldiae]